MTTPGAQLSSELQISVGYSDLTERAFGVRGLHPSRLRGLTVGHLEASEQLRIGGVPLRPCRQRTTRTGQRHYRSLHRAGVAAQEFVTLIERPA